MQVLDWVNDIMRWSAQFIPEWDLLEPTEGGLKFKPGGVVVELKPGHIYWWWPITTKVRTIPIKRQTLTFGQRLTTADEVTVQVSTVIVFTVKDVRKALLETQDFDDTVGEIAQKVTIKPIMSRNFDMILSDLAESNKMRNEVSSNARSMLSDYGVNVLDGYVCDFTITKVLSVEGDGLVINSEEEEEE